MPTYLKHASQMQRNLEIDTLRGLACIMLVSFHVAGAGQDVGLHLSDTDGLQRLNLVLSYLRMPLFSFLSGYVYAHRPFQGHTITFIEGKARRLLLPMLTLGTIFAIVQSLTLGANSSVNQWWLLHIIPVGHYWFLEALFIVFLIVMGLEKIKALSRLLGFSIVWGISVLLHELIVPPPYFALDGVVYLLPFFLAGLACKRFELGSDKSRLVATAALIGAATFLWLLWEPHTSPGQKTLLSGLVAGVSSAFLLLRSGWRSPWLAYVGSYSFAIYLLHIFFTAGSRITFTQLHVTHTYALLLLGTTFGITGPIVAAMLIRRSPRLNRWLLGSSAKMSVSPPPALHSDAAD